MLSIFNVGDGGQEGLIDVEIVGDLRLAEATAEAGQAHSIEAIGGTEARAEQQRVLGSIRASAGGGAGADLGGVLVELQDVGCCTRNGMEPQLRAEARPWTWVALFSRPLLFAPPAESVAESELERCPHNTLLAAVPSSVT